MWNQRASPSLYIYPKKRRRPGGLGVAEKEKDVKRREEKKKKEERGGAPSPEQHLRRPPRPPAWSSECPRRHQDNPPRRRSQPSPKNQDEVAVRSTSLSSGQQFCGLRPSDLGHHRPHEHHQQTPLTTGNKPQSRTTAIEAASPRKTAEKNLGQAVQQLSATTILSFVLPTQVAAGLTTATT